ncbi:MAG: DUF1566 domain-containing protein [Lachnospiraceae bacterium]|nr:DUF1566 domain-containing protein [Lachnospiraceae bacterium]
MKKTAISILIAFLTLSMAACSSTNSQSTSSDESIVKPDEALVESDNSTVKELEESENNAVISQYEIGDIILADGSVIREADLTIIDSSNVPIAVIAGFQEDGTAFGVGVHRSDTPLQWAADDSGGYVTNFAENICIQESDFDFSGDIDGSDNWTVICAQDNEDTADAITNYPAFYFVNTYAETYKLAGDYASGWYMPSIAELCDIYQNREAVNDSLQHIYSLDDHAAMNGLETNWYWSSSQASSEDDYAWFVHYFNGYAGECPKNFTNVHALAVRAF